jgi:recombination protein RecT
MSNPLTPAQRPQTAIEKMRGLLSGPGIKGKIEEVLGQRAPQFASSIIQLISASRQLQECDPNSTIAAAMTAAVLDLPIDKNLGFAHIIPYGQNAQFQMGAKGLIQLAIRSGQYKHLNATEVYEGEFVSYNRLTGDLKVDFAAKKSETVVGYAAYFQLVSGYEQAVYWSVEDVTSHAKKFSQAFKAGKKDSPWFTNFDAMGRKTVVKDLLSHWGIMSVQMQKALVEDQAVHRTIDSEAEYVDNLKTSASKPEHALTDAGEVGTLKSDDGDLGPAKKKPEAKIESQVGPAGAAGPEAGKPDPNGGAPEPGKVVDLEQPKPTEPAQDPAPAQVDGEVEKLLAMLRPKMEANQVTEVQVLAYCKKNKLCSRVAEKLTDMVPAKLAILIENFDRLVDKIKV